MEATKSKKKKKKSIDAKKIELIEWIAGLDDTKALEDVLSVKSQKEVKPKKKKRDFSDVKGIFTYVAEDFNAPLDDLKDYM